MKFLLLTCLLWKFLLDIEACGDMQNTIEVVQDCPRTKALWDARAAQKNCSTKCLESRYHCLITEKMDSYIEVCAEPKYMQGYCAYYDPVDNKVKGLYSADCSTFKNPCPTRYYSMDAYLYTSCYDIVQKYVTVGRSTTVGTLNVASNITISKQDDEITTTDTVRELYIVLPVVAVIIIVVVLIVLVVIWFRRKRPQSQKKYETESGNELNQAEQGPLIDNNTENNLNETEQKNSMNIKDELVAEISRLKEEYEARLAIMNKEMALLKTQKEKDNQQLKIQVLEKNKECKRLNNKLQEAKGNIRVLCRIKNCAGNSVLSTTKTTVSVNGTAKKYTFERVFDRTSTQLEVYEDIHELIRSFLDGYNLCIFAYGQTGSGKTYTMEGPHGDMSDDNEGIIPRSMKQVFQTIEELKVTGWTYELRVSYLELYNEEIKDLTKGSNDKEKHEITYPDGEKGKAAVSNIKEEVVQSTDEALKFYKQSSKNRTAAKTGRNERSSRSHAIFRVEMTGKVENVEGNQETCSGTLTLVDLAGSERLDNTASATTNQETKKINLSLMELSNVLRRLQRKETPMYRNSKLTFLLKNSLGGNSKTLMIVNVSPADDCKKETERTLDFGREVSRVVLENVPRKNK